MSPDIDRETVDRTEKPQEDRARRYSPFVPIMLLTLTLVFLAGFQSKQLAREHDALQATKFNQETPLDESKKLRAQLNSIASQTAKLALTGNSNAQAVMDALNKMGIIVNPDGVEPN
jgi:hypothetical protein